LALPERTQAGVEGVTGDHVERMIRLVHRSTFVCLTGITLACMATTATGTSSHLPHIGPAPGFSLIDQDGKAFSLRSAQGRVAVVTFIFTSCSSTCPLLTAKLVSVQRDLGSDAPNVIFTAITVDPLHDTPATLKKYAQAYSADTSSFLFLTGSFEQIDDVSRRYAVFRKAASDGEVEHTFLTSLVDRQGTLRVQYLGTRFDTGEFLQDLRSLLEERP
jgi:protein SCO1/2